MKPSERKALRSEIGFGLVLDGELQKGSYGGPALYNTVDKAKDAMGRRAEPDRFTVTKVRVLYRG